MKTIYTRFFEKVLRNPYDQKYEALFKKFISLKDPGTKVEKEKGYGTNEWSILRKEIKWSIRFNRPDSPWGSWWDVFQLHAVKIANNQTLNSLPLKKFELAGAQKLPSSNPVIRAFLDKSAQLIYPHTSEVKEWQEENIKNFENMIKFIENYSEKRSTFQRKINESTYFDVDYKKFQQAIKSFELHAKSKYRGKGIKVQSKIKTVSKDPKNIKLEGSVTVTLLGEYYCEYDLTFIKISDVKHGTLVRIFGSLPNPGEIGISIPHQESWEGLYNYLKKEISIRIIHES